MRCPECLHDESKVIDSRPAEHKIRRRRECLKCAERFTTYEIIEDISVMVKKRDGSVESFNRQKLTERVLRATAKRPNVSSKQVDSLVEGVHAHFKFTLQKEVPSAKIGEFVMRRLKAIDEVAYVRFASVYRQFNDTQSFISLIQEMNEEEPE